MTGRDTLRDADVAARSTLRRARNHALTRPLVEALDRFWWARTIRRSHLVDLDVARMQGGYRSRRAAVRAYVRGGFRRGMVINFSPGSGNSAPPGTVDVEYNGVLEKGISVHLVRLDRSPREASSAVTNGTNGPSQQPWLGRRLYKKLSSSFRNVAVSVELVPSAEAEPPLTIDLESAGVVPSAEVEAEPTIDL